MDGINNMFNDKEILKNELNKLGYPIEKFEDWMFETEPMPEINTEKAVKDLMEVMKMFDKE